MENSTITKRSSMGIRLIAFLTIALIVSTARGEESIRALFKSFEEKADLSNITKQESLGHVMVFTRKDLEIMQAYTLGDVLKSIPSSSFMVNNFGFKTFSIPGTMPAVPIIFRLFIDDHEVSSIYTYNPFQIYDDYPLDNIDHIEVYCSLGAIAVSNQPSQMIIRMYTKKPSRENASKLRLTVDTKKSYTLSFLDARQINDYSSYLIMATNSYLGFSKPIVNNHEVNRNQNRSHLFIKYSYFDTLFESSFSYVKRGFFLGMSADKSPDNAYLSSANGYIALTQNFLQDKSLKLLLTVEYNQLKQEEKNRPFDRGIVYIPYLRPGDPITFVYQKRNFYKYSATLEKTFITERNKLLTGIYGAYYRQSIPDSKLIYASSYTTKVDAIIPAYKGGTIYAEDSFNINEKNLLIAGTRFDYHKYSRNNSHKKINLRAGLVSILTNELVLKGFASKFYVIPSMYTLELAKNHTLDDIDVHSWTIEAKYTKGKHLFKAYYKGCDIKGIFVPDPDTKKLINLDKTIVFNVYSFLYTYKINLSNKLEINYWWSDRDSVPKYTPQRGGYIKLFTEYKNFQMYNELIYRGHYNPFFIGISPRYDYNIAVSYRLPYEWYIKLKGENLLNRGIKIGYRNIFDETGTITVYDKKLIFTVEKVF